MHLVKIKIENLLSHDRGKNQLRPRHRGDTNQLSKILTNFRTDDCVQKRGGGVAPPHTFGDATACNFEHLKAILYIVRTKVKYACVGNSLRSLKYWLPTTKELYWSGVLANLWQASYCIQYPKIYNVL